MKIATKRVIMRRFEPRDTDAMVEINADPKVMECFSATMNRSESLAFLNRIEKHWSDNGFGLFALELRETGQMIGFTGLTNPPYETPFTPCIEVGWRITPQAWGKGLAFEAATACLRWGFTDLGLEEIVSFTYIGNQRSTRLMQRLDMLHNETEDFNHPMLAPDSPLLRHVLYRISKGEWVGKNLS